jgi:hypothetical protein
MEMTHVRYVHQKVKDKKCSQSVRIPRNGWITRRWSFGPLLPGFLQEKEEDILTKSPETSCAADVFGRIQKALPDIPKF